MDGYSQVEISIWAIGLVPIVGYLIYRARKSASKGKSGIDVVLQFFVGLCAAGFWPWLAIGAVFIGAFVGIFWAIGKAFGVQSW